MLHIGRTDGQRRAYCLPLPKQFGRAPSFGLTFLTDVSSQKSHCHVCIVYSLLSKSTRMSIPKPHREGASKILCLDAAHSPLPHMSVCGSYGLRTRSRTYASWETDYSNRRQGV